MVFPLPIIGITYIGYESAFLLLFKLWIVTEKWVKTRYFVGKKT